MVLDAPIPLTPRLRVAVERRFAERDRAGAIHSLERVDLGAWKATEAPVGRERVLAAILELAHGDDARLWAAIQDAERDRRDVLVWAGLGDGDWSELLDERLGPGDS